MNSAKQKVCISSVVVKEESFKDYRFAVSKAVESLGYIAVRNPESTGITQEDFENILHTEHPVFILIMGVEGSITVNREFKIALANMLPIFIFLKTDESHNINENTIETITNITEIGFNIKCTTFCNCEELYSQVEIRLKKYITAIQKSHVEFDSDAGAVYNGCIEDISKAKKSIILYQSTSSLILGPRKGRPFEEKFYTKLYNWINEKQNNMQFLHVFSIKNTLQEIKKKSVEYDISEARGKLLELWQKFDNDPNFVIRSVETTGNEAFTLMDLKMIVVLPVVDRKLAIVLPPQHMRIAQVKKLRDQVSTAGKPLSLNDMLTTFYKTLCIE